MEVEVVTVDRLTAVVTRMNAAVTVDRSVAVMANAAVSLVREVVMGSVVVVGGAKDLLPVACPLTGRQQTRRWDVSSNCRQEVRVCLRYHLSR